MVTVDNAGLVAAMRGQWVRPLLTAFQGGLRGRPINRIVFEYGNSGADIVAPETGKGDWTARGPAPDRSGY